MTGQAYFGDSRFPGWGCLRQAEPLPQQLSMWASAASLCCPVCMDVGSALTASRSRARGWGPGAGVTFPSSKPCVIWPERQSAFMPASSFGRVLCLSPWPRGQKPAPRQAACEGRRSVEGQPCSSGLPPGLRSLSCGPGPHRPFAARAGSQGALGLFSPILLHPRPPVGGRVTSQDDPPREQLEQGQIRSDFEPRASHR